MKKTYSQLIKERKENQLEFFFGKDLKKLSNQYFTFEHVIDNDNIIIVTKDIKFLKSGTILVVDNNKGVYLKNWQLQSVKNYDLGFEGYAVKLNRNFFKPYTFGFDFNDLSFETKDTFDSLLEIAKKQNDTKIATGHFKY